MSFRDTDLIIDEKLEESLLAVIVYSYKEEWESFCIEFDLTLSWGDDVVFEEKHKSHIYYHLELINRKLNEGAQ